MDPLHSHTLGDVVREHRRSRPRGTAVVDGEVRLAWPDLDRRTSQLANAWADLGVGAGGRIVWMGQNSFRMLESLFAAAKLGAAVCPVNWRQPAPELASVVDDLRPAVVVWQEAAIGDAVGEARSRSAHQATWLQHDADGDGSYEATVAAGSPVDPDVDVDPASPVLLLYTAAFDGRPKAAQLDHHACVIQGLIVAMVNQIDSSYRYLNSGPLFHAATLMSTMATAVMGGTNVFTPRVDAEQLCRLIETERCTGAFIVGPTVQQIVDVNRDGRYDLSSLRTFAGPPEWNEMITVDTSPVARHPAGYGQTEVTGMLSSNALDGPGVGNAGRPAPVAQVRIVDPDGNDVPDGETGEMVVRGPLVMSGYVGHDDENARRTRGGWHHTDDLARREEDGSLTFVGPRTRLIKSAAENIYPVEVEQCLRAHPAVQEAAVIGVPDAQWTQSVKAIVVLAEGAEVTADELIEHCKGTIASYKKPRSVELVAELPRTGWQVDYDALDAQFGGGGYPGLP